MIIPSAEPFFYPGGTVGVLLVHGFTGTPKEMRAMGAYLSTQGYSVLAPRLAGHATLPEDMVRLHWQDWLSSLEDGYQLLKGVSKHIVVAGLSMGGVLTLLFAARFEISACIAMSTPYELPRDPRLPLLNLLWRWVPRIPKDEPDWQDPAPAEDHVDYPFYPTKSILELNKLLSTMQAALPHVQVPTLLMHSKLDGAVPYESMEKIYTRLGSQHKEKLTIENSGHVLTRDLGKRRVFESADSFIRNICGSPA